MNVKLSIPKEPKDVKEKIQSFNQKSSGGSIDWASLNVWFGNQLPKYLWKEWQSKLKPVGFTWQKFLKLLKFKTGEIISWSQDQMEWKDLIKEIKKLINSPLGENIKK